MGAAACGSECGARIRRRLVVYTCDRRRVIDAGTVLDTFRVSKIGEASWRHPTSDENRSNDAPASRASGEDDIEGVT